MKKNYFKYFQILSISFVFLACGGDEKAKAGGKKIDNKLERHFISIFQNLPKDDRVVICDSLARLGIKYKVSGKYETIKKLIDNKDYLGVYNLVQPRAQLKVKATTWPSIYHANLFKANLLNLNCPILIYLEPSVYKNMQKQDLLEKKSKKLLLSYRLKDTKLYIARVHFNNRFTVHPDGIGYFNVNHKPFARLSYICYQEERVTLVISRDLVKKYKVKYLFLDQKKELGEMDESEYLIKRKKVAVELDKEMIDILENL